MTRLIHPGLALACAFVVTSTALVPPGMGQVEPAPPPPGQVTPDPWPRTLTVRGAKYSLYQPQVDSWDGRRLAAHAAVSVLAPAAKEPVFGVIEIAAKTNVSRVARTVDFQDITITRATFPSAPQDAAQYQRDFQTVLDTGRSTMSLDRLEAMLGKLFKVGKLPINTSLQAYYNVEKPKFAADWQLRFQIQFLLPDFK